MSLRTLAVVVAALLALLVLLWTCAPDKLAGSPSRDALVTTQGVPAHELSHLEPAGAGAQPARDRVLPAAASELSVASCRRVAIALRCREHLDRVRLSRGAKQLSQPPADGACTEWESRPVPWRPLFAAAKQGHVPSMVRFSDGSLFRHNVEWDLEAMALYRTHGYEFLRRAAEAGDGSAIARLSREMVAESTGEGAIPLDRVKGLAYARLLLRHADPDWQRRLTSEMIGSAQRFTPEEWAQAESLSHQLVPAAAEDRLEGWSPNRNAPENDYGCAG